MSETDRAVFNADRKQLATLFGAAIDSAERLWLDEELGSILLHQLATPIQIDLSSLEKGSAVTLREQSGAFGVTLKSFGDLLSHPNPPEALLKATKDFAKACRLSPHRTLPPEIASVLYYASIAAALVRCGSRITSLSSETMRVGFSWMCSQPWVDERTRALAKEALALLQTHPSCAK